MKTKLNIPQEVLMNTDFMNTVNGGMSEPVMKIENREDGYELMIKAPGIGPEELQVEIVKDRLMVYHLLPIFARVKGEESEVRSIRFLSRMVIPSDVDLESISARYDEDRRHLILHLPFNHLHQDFHRKVDIERW
jgi:HSP20 family molecular chaperone IbpA